jgi:AcrR family transcriptional regulator
MAFLMYLGHFAPLAVPTTCISVAGVLYSDVKVSLKEVSMVEAVADPKEARELAVRDAKRQLILDAAQTVFSLKGYWDTRLEDIAAAAGFSKASLYNYYPDKEAIFLSLAIREYDTVVTRIAATFDPQAGIRANIHALLKTVLDSFGEHFGFLVTTSNYQTAMLLHMDMVKKHGELVEQFHKGIDRVGVILLQMIAAARANSELDSRVDDQTLARFIGAVIRGTLLEWKTTGRMGDVDEAIGDIGEFLAHGIGVREVAAR